MQTLTTTREPEWLRPLFKTIDMSDASGFCAHLTEDAVFRFGNAPATHGRAAIEDAVRGFFASMRCSRHQISRVWLGAGSVALDGFVTYTRLDGSEVTLPFADTMVLRGSLVAEYYIYVDVAPLFAPQR